MRMPTLEQVTNLNEFHRWAKMQMAYQNLNQMELAEKMGVPAPRISEAFHGKPTGLKYIIPIIQALDGNMEDFSNILPD